MITLNRSDIYATSNIARQAKTNQDPTLQTSPASLFVSGQANSDVVTISSAARNLAKGKSVETPANTYDQLGSARQVKSSTIESSLYAADTTANDPEVNLAKKLNEKPISFETFYQDAMQAIVDNRLGIDKEKLKEIEAMMAEVANDDSLSPEEKAKKLEQLQELMEKEIEESIERTQQQMA